MISRGSGSGLLPCLLQRELGSCRRAFLPNSFSHAFSCSGQRAGVIRVDPDGEPCPPYSITYNQVVHDCRLLTVGDEEGCVSILDTSSDQLPTSLYTDLERPPRAKWLAHNNTIFDMAWAKQDSVLYTASGDQHVGVWDTTAGRLQVYCSGHEGSVKAVCPHSSQPDVFASGSRDGVILVWDLRSPTRWSAARRRPQLGPVMRISIAATPAQQHGPAAAAAAAAGNGAAGAGAAGATPNSTSRGRRRVGSTAGGLGAAAAGGCRRSVTSLLFVHNEHTLISSSDMDGVVKLWDLRQLSSPAGELALPTAAAAAAAAGRGAKRSKGGSRDAGDCGADESESVCWLGLSCPSRSSRPAGITSMSLSPAGDMLLVSSIDSCHYLYGLGRLDGPPLHCLSGHRTDSFCIKSCFSPDGTRVLSGSSDRSVYIWDVTQPEAPPVALPGHTGEVTAVAWCPSDNCQLATAGDDATLRVWTMDRAADRYQRGFDHANHNFRAQDDAAFWTSLGLGSNSSSGNDHGSCSRAKHGQAAGAGGSASVATVGRGAGKAVTSGTSICSPTTPQLPSWRNGEATTTTTAAAAAAAGGCGSMCLTPQVLLRQGFMSPLPVPQQNSIASRKCAASQQPAAAQQGSQQEQEQQQHEHEQQEQEQQAATDTVQAVAEPLPEAASGPIIRPTADVQQQHQHAPYGRSSSVAHCDAAGAALVGSAGAGAGGAAVFDQWMRALTPSPASSPDCAASPAHGAACAAGAAGGCEEAPVQAGSSRMVSHVRRGGLVEAATPWQLPTPLRHQRQHEQAALEAERLQQSQRRLQHLALGGKQLQQQEQQEEEAARLLAAAATGGPGCADSASGRDNELHAHNAGMSCCRLLQDDFDVYCDNADSSPRGVQAPVTSNSSMEEGEQSGQAATISCQENLWQQQATRAVEHEEAAGRHGSLQPPDADADDDDEAWVVAATPADVDVVPASLPVDATQDPDAEQQGSEVRRVEHQPHQQLTYQQAGVAAPAGCENNPVVLGEPSRMPLGELPVLPPVVRPANLLSPDRYGHGSAPAGSPGAGPGAAALLGLGTGPRNSPVRVLSLVAADGQQQQQQQQDAPGSPLLQMLRHNMGTRQQQQQQQSGGSPGGRVCLIQVTERGAAQSPGSGSGGGARRLSRLGPALLPSMVAMSMPGQQLLGPTRQVDGGQAAATTLLQYDEVGLLQQQSAAGSHGSHAAAAAAPGPPGHQARMLLEAAEPVAKAAAGLAGRQQTTPAGVGDGGAQGHDLAEQYEGAEHNPAAAAAAGAGGGRAGGSGSGVVRSSIKRSSAGPGSSRKRQCKLADLWGSHQECEDGFSRFSGHY